MMEAKQFRGPIFLGASTYTKETGPWVRSSAYDRVVAELASLRAELEQVKRERDEARAALRHMSEHPGMYP